MIRNRTSAFQKPENALKRAEELQRVGQKTAAVLALHDVLTSRRHRTWVKGLEDIVYKFIDLCVEEGMGRYAKEALMQYRNTCQNVSINSLEEVVKYLIKKATDRAEEAQAKADAAIQEIDDLDEAQSPEDLMLSYVSDKSSKDRTDRELVAPWFKFLWETYRNVLDILRNNVKFTQLYGLVTKQAFQFCLQYKRNTEFRRLCEILRNQLVQLKKNRDNRDGNRDRPDLSNPETLNQCLETRFEQLNVACQLEMWQEAFRSIEDIHGLWTIHKKNPKVTLRAQYFSCLTEIFSKSGSHLYHAYSWYQLYVLSERVNKNLSATDKQQMASAVLLATLSIDPYERKGPESLSDHPKTDRAARIVDILGFNYNPNKSADAMLSRANLLSELTRCKILSAVPEEIAAIYRCLELDRDPLHLCKAVAPYLQALEEKSVTLSPAAPVSNVDLAQHVAQLKAVAVLKMMRQLSTVYSIMRVDRLTDLIPFMAFAEVEAVLADAIKFGYIQVRIDHRTGTLHFGGASLRSDAMNKHLSVVAERLSGIMTLVKPADIDREQSSRRATLATRVAETAEKENKDYLARKVLIERRKEENERALLEAEREEEEKRRAEQLALERAEEQRRAEEARKREEDRINREFAEQEAEEVRKLMREKGIAIKDGENLDKRTLLQKQFELKQKEQNEFEARMAKLLRNMDHLERARREEAAPYLEQMMQERAKDHRAYYEADQQRQLAAHRKKWEQEVQAKQDTMRMTEDRDQFKGQIEERRAAEFSRLRAAMERRRRELLQQRHEERIRARKEKYVEKCRTELQERLEEMAEKAREEAEEEKRREKEAQLERLRQRKEQEAAEEAKRQEARLEANAERIAQLEADLSSGKFIPRGRRDAMNAELEALKKGEAPPAAAPAAAAAASGAAPAASRPFGASRGFGSGASRDGPPRDGPGPRDGARDGPAPGGARRYEAPSAFQSSRPRAGGYSDETPSAFGGPRRGGPYDGPPQGQDAPRPMSQAPPSSGGSGSAPPARRGYIPPSLRGK